MTQRWAGSVVRAARAHWLPRLPLPCRRCGRPVVNDPSKRNGGWTVGHIEDRWTGGSDSITNTWPEHSGCNYSAGGKVGAAMTNSRRPAVVARMESEQARGIVGIRGPGQ